MSLYRRGNNFPKARSSSVITGCISIFVGTITRQWTATCAGTNESDSNDESNGDSDGSSDADSDGSSDADSDGSSDADSDGSSDRKSFTVTGRESNAYAYGKWVLRFIDAF